MGMSILLNSDMRNKIKFSFRILDYKDKNMIELNDLVELVQTSLQYLTLIKIPKTGIYWLNNIERDSEDVQETIE